MAKWLFIKKRLKDLRKIRLEILLFLILFFVSIPYALAGLQQIEKWNNQQRVQREYELQQKKEQEAVEKQGGLIKKYGISVLELDYSYSGKAFEFPIYSFPEAPFLYLKVKQEINSNEDGYNCETPPDIAKIKSTSQFFKDTEEFLSRMSIESFLKKCSELKSSQNDYEKLESEITKITKLIKDSNNSNDYVIQRFVQKLSDDFETYNKFKINAGIVKLLETNSGYLQISPESIKKGEFVSFEYGYIDKLNNEHLKTAITTVTVESPSGKKFQALYAKKFPSDFKGANTTESGIYIVNVERKVKATNGSYDILFRAMSGFQVK